MTARTTKCLCIEVRSAAQKLTRLYDDALTDVGITVTQLSQLNAISELGSPTVSELAAVTELDRSTLGRNLKIMEKSGLVSIRAGRDARTREVKLTRFGVAALKKGGQHWFKLQSSLVDRLGAKKRELLQQLLTELSSEELIDHVRN